MVSLFALLGYLGCFTVMKFKRVKLESIEFKKIQKGVKGVSAADVKKVLANQNLEKDFINGKEDGKPLKTLLEMQQLKQKRNARNGPDIDGPEFPGYRRS